MEIVIAMGEVHTNLKDMNKIVDINEPTSIPASTKEDSTSALLEAGPRVQTILVLAFLLEIVEKYLN